MKRTEPEPDGSDLDHQRVLRDHFVIRMNALLSNPNVRKELGIIPALYFSRLVTNNRAHMCWDRPEDVFDQAPGSRVRMNIESTMDWINSVEGELAPTNMAHNSPYPLRRLYKELFVDGVEFVSWQRFRSQFMLVVDESVRAIKEKRDLNPLRITLLILNVKATDKSNAWLIGYAWKHLASIVDYIVSDNNSTAQFLRALFGSMDEADSSADDYQIDLIYVDDMIYSGQQASDLLFDQVKVEDRPLMSHVHIHIATPFIADKGLRKLMKYKPSVGTITFAPSMVRVQNYEAKVRSVINTIYQNYDRSRVKDMLLKIVLSPLPTIVFEHKLADEMSLPLFLSWGTDEFKISMPHLVNVTTRTAVPFYKHPTFRWRMARSPTSQVVELFTDISTLFATLQRHWAAEPTCASCGEAAKFTCAHCDIMPYCSLRCRHAHPAAVLDCHERYCARLTTL